ncbi:hypothetical protein Pelo_7377D [Pelomyxa schiedti]|nr:hypothetical protein Pelo_7377D [Pelomyxa schiedti]
MRARARGGSTSSSAIVIGGGGGGSGGGGAGPGVVVIDNGGYTCKIGCVPNPTSPTGTGTDDASSYVTPRIVPNAVAKHKKDHQNYVASEIYECNDTFNLLFKRPLDKGYLVDIDLQKQIWDSEFSIQQITPNQCGLLVTEAPFAPNNVRNLMLQLVFEIYGFESLYLAKPAEMAAFGYRINNPSSSFAKSPCYTVVDCGFSFTHTTPFFDNIKLNYAVKRVDVGGKVLTNYLKETISFRQWNMMEETTLINTVKEGLCFVSSDFVSDMKLCKRPRTGGISWGSTDPSGASAGGLSCGYVLPNYKTTSTGYTLDGERDPHRLDPTSRPKDLQILKMGNERIVVPEILFSPSDIGIEQAGVSEATVQAINECHPHTHPSLYSNVLLIGGSSKFRGFQQRMFKDIRASAPDQFNVNIFAPPNPITCAWDGASSFVTSGNYAQHAVSLTDYHEMGANYLLHQWVP